MWANKIQSICRTGSTITMKHSREVKELDTSILSSTVTSPHVCDVTGSSVGWYISVIYLSMHDVHAEIYERYRYLLKLPHSNRNAKPWLMVPDFWLNRPLHMSCCASEFHLVISSSSGLYDSCRLSFSLVCVIFVSLYNFFVHSMFLSKPHHDTETKRTE